MTQYQQLAKTLQAQCPDLLLAENERLAGYTTFAIGGPCPLVAFPSTQEEVVACFTLAGEFGVPYYILGNGSNLLISDQGVERFIIHSKKFSQILSQKGLEITAQSGLLLGRLANFAAERGLSGLEFAQGIPGSLGGATVMNAGAYGGEMQQIITSVTSYCPKTQSIRTRSSQELDFSYRHSLFHQISELILTVTLTLHPGDPQEIAEKMQEFSAQRKEKQPLNLPSCGSTFKRPPGHFAAALIDQCGLKGCTVGGAQVSTKHAGFVVNIGGATCQDVLNLVREIRATVLRKTGVELELEVELLP